MRLEAFAVTKAEGLVRLHLVGVYAGECCDAAMTPQQARRLAAELVAAAQERPPCPKCGSRRVDILLPNPWGEEWECLRCGHRWSGEEVRA